MSALLPAVAPAFETTLDVARIRRDFPILQRRVNGKPLVYLDNAATSQKPAAMIERMTELYSCEYARVEEGHTLSDEATRAFERTRAKVARLINAAEPREVVFCRGATEGLNLIARSFENGILSEGDEVLVTEAEHHSNIVPWLLACRKTGAALRVAPVLPNGDVDLAEYERLLTGRVKLAGVVHVSNVTGGVNPVKRMTELAHARGIPVLVDGAQAVPHIPVDVRDIGCEFYAGSGHKMGGPPSVGFLYGRADRLEALPLADGGSTMAEHVSFTEVTPKPIPQKFEAGEPAFGEVEAWGPAVDYWTALGLGRIAAYERALTAYAAERVSGVAGARVVHVLQHARGGRRARRRAGARGPGGLALGGARGRRQRRKRSAAGQFAKCEIPRPSRRSAATCSVPVTGSRSVTSRDGGAQRGHATDTGCGRRVRGSVTK